MSVTIGITGMHCAACATRVEAALSDVAPGATVNLASRTATLAETAQLGDASEALARAGYGVDAQAVTLAVSGLNCATAARDVEAILSGIDGVRSVTASSATAQIRFEYIGGDATLPKALAALRGGGFEATLLEGGAPASGNSEGQALRRVIIAALLTVPVFVTEMGGHLSPAFHEWTMATLGHWRTGLLQAVLTALVLVWPGWHILRRGFVSLLRQTPDMNALVAIGASAAYLYSLVVLLAPGWLPESARGLYFEAAAVIVTLILLGRYLEERARGRSGQAIEALLARQPDIAHRLIEGGGTEDVPVANLVIGDRVIVRPGARVPIDGVVHAGMSHLDESMITGEAHPVAKGPGDTIVGGTVNGNALLEMDVTATGGDTVLARIGAMVMEAQATKLPIQNLVDRVTRWFVPAVLLIAVLTAILWLSFGPGLTEALVAAVSVLIIACPCAMGLAVPVSVMAGTGRAAEMGVLFRRGDALQKLASVDVVAFDKTGTLTTGAPKVTMVQCQPGWSTPEVLTIVGAVEQQSDHPIAHAIVAEARDRNLTLTEAWGVSAVPGRGITGRVDGQEVFAGNAGLLEEHGIATHHLRGVAAKAAENAETLVYVAIRGELAGLVTVADPVKPEARAVIDALKGAGVKVALITGDTAAPAQTAAARLGIEHVVPEVLPEGKVAALDTLRRDHGVLAFVGDGINDGPALAAADIGIALGTGTDVAVEAAEVVLSSGDLRGVLRARDVSRRTVRNMRQNLAWAFGYNILLIPVAAGALVLFGGPQLSPMLAAGAMALSSLAVVLNALRLTRAPMALVGVATDATLPIEEIGLPDPLPSIRPNYRS